MLMRLVAFSMMMVMPIHGMGSAPFGVVVFTKDFTELFLLLLIELFHFFEICLVFGAFMVFFVEIFFSVFEIFHIEILDFGNLLMLGAHLFGTEFGPLLHCQLLVLFSGMAGEGFFLGSLRLRGCTESYCQGSGK